MRWYICCLFLEIPHKVVHLVIWCLFLEIPHEVVHLVFVLGDPS